MGKVVEVIIAWSTLIYLFLCTQVKFTAPSPVLVKFVDRLLKLRRLTRRRNLVAVLTSVCNITDDTSTSLSDLAKLVVPTPIKALPSNQLVIINKIYTIMLYFLWVEYLTGTSIYRCLFSWRLSPTSDLDLTSAPKSSQWNFVCEHLYPNLDYFHLITKCFHTLFLGVSCLLRMQEWLLQGIVSGF